MPKNRSRKWRTEKMCSNCPFASSGPGLHLRKSLTPGRWKEILDSLRNQGHFFCHKTGEFDDEWESIKSGQLICAGSIDWQDKHGTSAQMVRIHERLDWFFQGKEPARAKTT
jgi:hypothetical protein